MNAVWSRSGIAQAAANGRRDPALKHQQGQALKNGLIDMIFCPPGLYLNLMPEGAIVSDEGNTSGLFAPGLTAGAPAHDWLCLTGGAIGQGLPVALGAASLALQGRLARS